MEPRKLLIAGCEGHASTCRALIDPESFMFIGYILENGAEAKPDIEGKVFYDSQIPELVKDGYVFHCGIGHIKSSQARRKVMTAINSSNGMLINLISSASLVLTRIKDDQGLTICANAYVGPNSSLGFGTIINTGAIIEHGVSVESYCHISTGAILNGDVRVGSGSFVGSGVVVKEGIKIGNDAIIQAGCFVRKDVKSGEVLLNVP